MTKKEKILQWLKDNDVFDKFYMNFKRTNGVTAMPPDDEFVEQAFLFANTYEGEKFWKDISERYKEWYNSEFNDDDYISQDDFDTAEKTYIFYVFENSVGDGHNIAIKAKTVKEARDHFYKTYPDLYYSNISIL